VALSRVFKQVQCKGASNLRLGEMVANITNIVIVFSSHQQASAQHVA
jgi:hypothetical protein